MRTSESTVELVKALVAARRAFAPVVKDTKGQIGQNREYLYADLAAILTATMPALTEQGVCVLQAVDAETSSLITRLAHVSGEWAESAYPLTLDLPPQALGSALTYGRRYSLTSLLCLAAADDDGAATAMKPTRAPSKSAAVAIAVTTDADARITPAQRRRLFSLAQAAGWTTEAMQAHLKAIYHVEKSTDVRASVYEHVCDDFSRAPQ